MEGPLFADPVMTSSIARLIVDNQKIPETWDPLLPIKLNYSPGFPSVLSWFYFFGSSFQTSALFLTNILIGYDESHIYICFICHVFFC